MTNESSKSNTAIVSSTIHEEPTAILLRNGTVLQHDDAENVQALRNTDVLVVGQRIRQIGQNLASEASALVVDCTDRIVSPGNLQAHNYTPSDVFWGQLAGGLELLDGATTTVVDHAHITVTPEHATAALTGTIVAGIRSVFCYGPTTFRPTKWAMDAFEIDRSTSLLGWFWTQLEQLARQSPFESSGLVQLGFFFDSYFFHPEVIRDIFVRVRTTGVKLITSYFRHFPLRTGQERIPEIPESQGLLGPDILLSHGNGVTESQAQKLEEAGVHIVSTPDAEISMASGQNSVAFRRNLQPLTCLGADCHTVGPGDMLHQMQIAIAQDRAAQVDAAFNQFKYPKHFEATIQAAFNLATIRSAQAIAMGSEIGSLTEGKLADIVVFDGTIPAMGCAAIQDLITAVVRHTSVRDVEMVIVDGRIHKSQSRLVDVDVTCAQGQLSLALDLPEERTHMSWSEIHKKLCQSAADINRRGEQQSVQVAKSMFLKMMGATNDMFM